MLRLGSYRKHHHHHQLQAVGRTDSKPVHDMLYGGNSFREKGSLLEDIRTVGCSQRRKFIAFCLCAILALIWFVPFSVELAGLGGHTSEASLEARIRKQERASFNRILGNIGPAAGAQDGLVVASKSQGEPDQPDYFVRAVGLPHLMTVHLDTRLGIDDEDATS